MFSLIEVVAAVVCAAVDVTVLVTVVAVFAVASVAASVVFVVDSSLWDMLLVRRGRRLLSYPRYLLPFIEAIGSLSRLV